MREFCGISLSCTHIGILAEQIAEEITEPLQHHPDIKNAFPLTEGETEFDADEMFIPIRDEDGHAEWNEMKTGMLVKRTKETSALP